MEADMQSLTLNETETTEDNSVLMDTSETRPVSQPLSFIKSILFGEYPFYGLNDIIMLPDGCFVVSMAHRRSVFKFTTDGTYVADHKYTDFEPFGLCYLQDNSIIVSQPQTKKLFIFDGDNLTFKDSFSLDKKYKRLASDDGEKIICLYRESRLHFDILSKDNPQSAYEIIKTIEMPVGILTCDDYKPRIIPSSGNFIVVQASKLPKVACFDQNGTVLYKYEGDPDDHPLQSVFDVEVSKDYVYIADKAGNKIHRITHDGKFVDVPLTENDDVLLPIKLCVNKKDELAILLKNSKTPQIKLYSNPNSK